MTKIEIIIIMLSSDIVSAHKRTLPLKDKVNKFAHTDLMHAKCVAPVAHLVVHRAVTREVVSSRLRPDQHSGS